MPEDVQVSTFADAVSALAFHPTNPSLLLSGNWDSNVYLSDLSAEEPQAAQKKFANRGAVLDVCWGEASETQVYVAGLSKEARLIDMATNSSTLIAKHEDAVKCVEYNPEHKVVITGSWDKTLRLSSPTASGPSPTSHVITLPDKVYSLSTSKTKLVAAMAGRAVWIWDIRMLGEVLEKQDASTEVEALQKRESSLKFMTRSVRCMPNDQGYVTTSIEGRVAVEFFDPAEEAQAKKYAFKCHRSSANGIDSVYPVSGLAFNPIYGTFATGGGDATVSLWDPAAKKRLRQFTAYPSPISALEFNCDGTKLAVGYSEDDNANEGARGVTRGGNGIRVKELGDEGKPKAR